MGEVPSKRHSLREDKGQPGAFKCEGRPAGYYADYERGCHVFYQCTKDDKIPFGCPADTCFCDKRKVCAPCNTVSCPVPDIPSKRHNGVGHYNPTDFSCKGKGDGLHADFYRGCHVHYLCSGGNKDTMTCGGDKCFDDTHKICKPCKEVTCPFPDEPFDPWDPTEGKRNIK